jgi:holliday junction DNA helicase RuvA
MIGSLRGSVLERNTDGTVLLEVGGVGYLVTVSNRVLAELEPGTPVFLYVHHHIREEAQTLYGFSSRDDRATFQALIATHGIGPALAVAILATHPPAALFDVVSNNDVAALTLVPGIGKKTAERLIIELRDRLSCRSSTAATRDRCRRWPMSARRSPSLGYGTDEIRDVLRELPTGADSSVLLRDALKMLGARRA